MLLPCHKTKRSCPSQISPFDVTSSTCVQPRSTDVLDCFFVLAVECFSQCLSRNKLPRVLGWCKEECNTSTTKSQRSRAGKPSMRRAACKETTSDSVELWKFASCTSNLWERMFDSWRYTGFSPRSILSLRGLQPDQHPTTIPLSNAVLYSHTTVLSVVTRAVNVRYQTSQAFVTSSCAFCDCSCHFVYRPKNVWSSTAFTCTSISGGFESRPLTNAPTVPILPFSNWLSSRHGVETLRSCSTFVICRFAKSFHAFLRMTFHIIRPSDRFRMRFFTTKQLFSCSGKDLRFEHLSVFVKPYFRQVYIRIESTPSTHDQEKM